MRALLRNLATYWVLGVTWWSAFVFGILEGLRQSNPNKNVPPWAQHRGGPPWSWE